MKISQIICQILRVKQVAAKTASCQDVVLVRVRSEDGLEGIGEADASPEVIKAIVDAPFSHNIACGLREILIGENPLETERLWQKMLRRTQYFGRASVTIRSMPVPIVSPCQIVDRPWTNSGQSGSLSGALGSAAAASRSSVSFVGASP